jgi:hypothetical protein
MAAALSKPKGIVNRHIYRSLNPPDRLNLAAVGKLLAVGVLHDEGFLSFLDLGGGKRRGYGMARW